MKPQVSKKHEIKWKETVIPDKWPDKCDHYFEFIGTECKCRKCGLGLIGVLQVENGKIVV